MKIDKDEFEEYIVGCKNCNTESYYYWPTLDMKHNFDRFYRCSYCENLFYINLYDLHEGIWENICKNTEDDEERCSMLITYLPKCTCGNELEINKRQCMNCKEPKEISLIFKEKVHKAVYKIEKKDILME